MRLFRKAALALAASWAGTACAFAGGAFDVSGADRLPGAPCGKDATCLPVYWDSDAAVFIFRVNPGSQRPFLRERGETLKLSVREQHYRSNKVVSTRPGRKRLDLEPGDYFYRAAGQSTGGWFVGAERPFEMLYVVSPPALPEPLSLEAGRRLVSDDAKPREFTRYRQARATLDAGSAPRVRLPTGGHSGLTLELLRLTEPTDVRGSSAAAAILFPVEGEARTEGSAETLRAGRIEVLDPGQSLRVAPSSGTVFYAYLVSVAHVPRPALGGAYDISRLESLPSAPVGGTGSMYTVYKDSAVGVFVRRIRPGGQRAFIRSTSDALVVALHPQVYRSNKVVSTEPGVKSMSLQRGDFFLRTRGQSTGGWYVGGDRPFDSLVVKFPPEGSDVLPLERGRRMVSDDRKTGLVRIADALAVADASTGTPTRTPLLDDGRNVRVELLHVSSAVIVADDSPASAVLLALRGDARAGIGRSGEPLGDGRVFVVGPGQPLRLDPLGGGPFDALLISAVSLEAAERTPATAPAAVPAPAAGPPAPSAPIEWVRIPGGTFRMGSGVGDEKPVHEVAIKTFEIGKTPVTFGQYRACVRAGACAAVARDCAVRALGDDRIPVVCVNWGEAHAFAVWAGGRLPSEAEWEYAARSGGKARRFPWGDEDATCDRAVLNHGDGSGCGRMGPWPVCSKPKGNTEQGLCDMAGNVWEWVEDWYHRGYRRAPVDGSAWEEPTRQRVQRGGTWTFDAAFARTTARSGDEPDLRGDYVGFRVARDAR